MTPWLIVRTDLGKEMVVARAIERMGCEVWVPLQLRSHRSSPHSKRRVVVEYPLLATRVFMAMPSEETEWKKPDTASTATEAAFGADLDSRPRLTGDCSVLTDADTGISTSKPHASTVEKSPIASIICSHRNTAVDEEIQYWPAGVATQPSAISSLCQQRDGSCISLPGSTESTNCPDARNGATRNSKNSNTDCDPPCSKGCESSSTPPSALTSSSGSLPPYASLDVEAVYRDLRKIRHLRSLMRNSASSPLQIPGKQICDFRHTHEAWLARERIRLMGKAPGKPEKPKARTWAEVRKILFPDLQLEDAD